ncbi:MAG: transcription-repair coupling factor [Tannerella sp.]|nr:transcription-repair coupling factor [Tannerella sp.]
MNLPDLLTVYAAHPQINAVSSLLDEGKSSNLLLKGLNGSGAAMTVASLLRKRKKTYVCILNDLEEAGYFYNDLSQLSGRPALFFPSAWHRHIKYGHIDPASEILRTETLGALQNVQPGTVIVTYPDALAEKVLSKEDLQAKTLKISVGEKLDVPFVSEVFDSLGFEQTDYVYEPGQYAMRGSIIDVFSFSNEYPYRIDFFGNEVETVRTFDVETQLSREKLQSVAIVSEISRSGEARISLFDLLPEDTCIVTQDLAWCVERVGSLWEEEPVQGGEASFPSGEAMRKLLVGKEDFLRSAQSFRRIQTGSKACGTPDAAVAFDTEPQPLYRKNFNLVSDSFRRYLSEGYTLYLLSDSDKQAERVRTIFQDRGDSISFTAVHGTVHDGFADHTLRLCVFTDHQIFGRYHKYNLKSDKARSGKIMLSLKELKQFSQGDYVVHIDHGVGQFGGLVRTMVNDRVQEAVKLIYRNSDILFVSIHSLHKLSKYKGRDGEPPTLNRLGSGAWERMKDRAKKKVKDIARDLIRLYARRRREKGFAFSPDSFMQDELEASFIYEDTPDQVKATADVKTDMESDRPMDRLICGDVGFGKTEVAIRAAFKAVADNKQVAILVPTTVLAYQHFQTFSERLKDFPCTVDYISRARSARDTRRILERLYDGEVNILIGTHRLVGQDVIFRDLGLLIVDEEQKFGVAVKEKLRGMKTNVDTLTMTATPIPRTLQFSLMGARDLSNIHTPPPNRYPIQTEVQRFHPDIVREAIEFEMSRNGQVFFINNRIHSIPEIEQLVRREAPDARIAIGHGQMEPDRLEKIILDFVNYEYDVLISTVIVENGLDIPNANTIIINDAHQFGLSELHQLRGRVGRSNRKAFCYLLSPPLSTLTPESRRRLQAIENFAELGSGIHIAMQDLDIRGAGNILGAEQSGFITDLGYETYLKILEEAVDELKTGELAELFAPDSDAVPDDGEAYVRETFVESDLALMFPPAYIPNDSERIGIYRELNAISDEAELTAFVSRLKDRFGTIPAEGEELIRVVRLRRLARKMGGEKIVLKKELMAMYLPSDPESPYYQSRAFGKIIAYIQQYPRLCNLREQGNKRSILIRHVTSVAAACRCLEVMDEMETETETAGSNR